MSLLVKQFKRKMGNLFSCLGSEESTPLSYRKRMLIIGDGECGKTCLVTRMSTGNFVDVGYLPTVFETEAVSVNTGREEVDLTIFDTAGQEDYDRLRPFSYHDIDVALLCFNLVDTDTVVNITEKWSPEVRYFCGNIPIILVGNKRDLRDTPDISVKSSLPSTPASGNLINDRYVKSDDNEEIGKNNEPGSLNSTIIVKNDDRLSTLFNLPASLPRVQPHVKHSEGALIAKRIGAVAYFETSAVTGENVEELLLATTKASVLGTKKSKKFNPFLQTLGNWTSFHVTTQCQGQEGRTEKGRSG